MNYKLQTTQTADLSNIFTQYYSLSKDNRSLIKSQFDLKTLKLYMDSFNVKYKSQDLVNDDLKSKFIDSLSGDLVTDILTKREIIVLIAGKESKRNNKELLKYALDNNLTDDETQFRTKKDIRQWLLRYRIQELYTHANNLNLKPDPSLSKSASENVKNLSLSRKIWRFLSRMK